MNRLRRCHAVWVAWSAGRWGHAIDEQVHDVIPARNARRLRRIKKHALRVRLSTVPGTVRIRKHESTCEHHYVDTSTPDLKGLQRTACVARMTRVATHAKY